MTVVALLVDASPDRHGEALRCGAHGTVAWEASPDTILATVSAALDATTLLPTSVARALARCGPPLYESDCVTPQEVEWLRLLGQGATVQQLADLAGYSERAFYRLLRGVYGRMRVSNRAEAIVQLGRWGLLER